MARFLAGELSHLPIMLSTIGTFIHAEKNMGGGGEIGRKAVIKKKNIPSVRCREFFVGESSSELVGRGLSCCLPSIV